MKKAIMALAAAGSLLASCTNESIAFDDFERQTIYMPYQYPVRTLSLGNDRIDNSLDRQHKFNMGVCVGGYYNSNKQDWRVDFEIDPPVLLVAVVISPDADAHVELMLPVERIVDAVVAQRQRSDRILIGHVDRLPLEIVESDRLVRAGSQQRSGGGQCHNCFFHKLCDVLIVTILGSVRAPSSVRRRGSARRSYNP